MTKEEIKTGNAEIATYVGWKFGTYKDLGYTYYPDKPVWIDPNQHGWENPPDYYNDLNEMYKAENALPEILHHEYHRQLYLISKPADDNMWKHNWNFIHASSQQKFNAFLNTIRYVDRIRDLMNSI